MTSVRLQSLLPGQEARGGAVARAAALTTGKLQVRFQITAVDLSIHLFLAAGQWPWGQLSR